MCLGWSVWRARLLHLCRFYNVPDRASGTAIQRFRASPGCKYVPCRFVPLQPILRCHTAVSAAPPAYWPYCPAAPALQFTYDCGIIIPVIEKILPFTCFMKLASLLFSSLACTIFYSTINSQEVFLCICMPKFFNQY